MHMERDMDRGRGLLLRTLLARADFLVTALVGMLALASFYYWLLLKVSTLETTLDNMAREPVYLAVIAVLAPASLLLFGFNLALSLLLFRARGGFRWQGGSLLGAFTGGFAAACPVCGSFLLSVLGVAGGLTVLPFAGLEIWTVSVVIMGVALVGSLRMLDRKTCEPTTGTAACWRLPTVQSRHLILLAILALALSVNLYAMLSTNEPSLRVQSLLLQMLR